MVETGRGTWKFPLLRTARRLEPRKEGEIKKREREQSKRRELILFSDSLPPQKSRPTCGLPSSPPLSSCSSSSETSFKENATQLSSIAEAFEELAGIVENKEELRLSTFCDACSLVSVLFGCLGVAFKFAEFEYVSKVNDLLEASKTFDDLGSILNHDADYDSVKKPGSLSRHLRRVRQGLDLIKALFEQFLSSSELSLRDAASTAYTQVCAPYHTWTIRKAVGAGMYTLPTRDQLILRLNETDESVEQEMRRYIVASTPVIKYIDNLFLSRNISLDW